jgi:hypothetical protein
MILRTYACPNCAFQLTVELRADQWDAEPPDCPQCEKILGQEFQPPAIGGSNYARARATAERIAEQDYGVADIQMARRQDDIAKVRYKDQQPSPASWGANREALEAAVAAGRQNRLQYGSGLDVLQQNLKSGVQPDLIELSKRRSARVW